GFTGEGDAAALGRKVRRRGLRLVVLSVVDVAVTVVALALFAVLARRGDAVDAFLAASMSVLTVALCASALWIRRGTYSPASESTAEFVRLSILRARRALLAIRAGWIALAVEAAALAPWLWHRATVLGSLRPEVLAFGLGLLLAVLAAAAAVLVTLGRRVRRDLREAEELQAALSELASQCSVPFSRDES
ncbi:MAG: hypothetical protein HY900_13980, partial [Deltaproteobacteria bacterium]|nr:hypothetical protein [Deltaproteobacteria bacterium]